MAVAVDDRPNARSSAREGADGVDDLVGHPLDGRQAEAAEDAVARAGVDQLGEQFAGRRRAGVARGRAERDGRGAWLVRPR